MKVICRICGAKLKEPTMWAVLYKTHLYSHTKKEIIDHLYHKVDFDEIFQPIFLRKKETSD